MELTLGDCLSQVSLWTPRRIVPSAWIEHGPFGFWVIEAANPKIVVELGVYSGYSYLAFCEAVHSLGLDTRCYGIDTWKGDEHGGMYGDEIFESLKDYHELNYSGFSQLIRSTFSEAVDYFDDGTVDLLHIDGRHLYQDVKGDFENWMPKLSNRAVVLFHDINVREREFGVAQFWGQLKVAFPHFEFNHGYGLGVLGFGKEVPGAVQPLFANNKTAAGGLIRGLYSRLGARINDHLRHDLRQNDQIARQGSTSGQPPVSTAQFNPETAVANSPKPSSGHEGKDTRPTAGSEARHAQEEQPAAELTIEREARIVDEARLAAELTTEREARIAEETRHRAELSEERERAAGLTAQLNAISANASRRITVRLRNVGASVLRQLRRASRLAWSIMTLRIISRAKRWRIENHDVEVIAQTGIFDRDWYRSVYPDLAAVKEIDPVRHYLRIGASEGRDPNPLFDTDWYLAENPDVREAGINPLVHYLVHGVAERRDPNPLFDTCWYLAENLDVRESGVNPLIHYLLHGAAEGRDPSLLFDTDWYLRVNPDVREAKVNPLAHYLRNGATEGRVPSPNLDINLYRLSGGLNDLNSLDLMKHARLPRSTDGALRSFAEVRPEAQLRALGSAQLRHSVNVTIGVVIYNTSELHLTRLIRSARRAIESCGANISARIRIIDNAGSYDHTKLPKEVEYILNKDNEGFGLGHNRLMEAAFLNSTDVYIGANPDGSFHPDCLHQLLRMNDAHAGRALIEALQFPEEHPKFYHPETFETPWISGACFLLPREIWTTTGGFDHNIFLYCEDVDLSWNARRHGFSTLTCPPALFYHDVSDRGRVSAVWRWREMLTSGRYLGHKWKNDAFCKWCEEQLISQGFAKGAHELPPLDDLPSIPDGDKIAVFRHMFHFGPGRW